MRPAPLALLMALALAGCSGSSDSADAPARDTVASPTGYPQDVRTNFLDSCLENATNTSKGAATREQLMQTCACILDEVEQEYSQAEFADFEKRLLGGTASDEESGRLVSWSTECARTSAS